MKIIKKINDISTYNDKAVEMIKINNQTFYICSVCGRLIKHKIKAYGKVYCPKHYKQTKKYGSPIDENPRTIYDKNEIRICGNIAYIDLYDKHCNVINTAIIDSDDVQKVRYIKWKLSNSGYVMNTPKYKNSNIHMSRVILGVDDFVDHINHNRLDNRKSNLRVVTKSQNAMNMNSKGVHNIKNKYYAHIKINQKQINLGVYIYEQEALFARWYAEKILFKEYCYKKEKPNILSDREQDIMKYVDRKVQRL